MSQASRTETAPRPVAEDAPAPGVTVLKARPHEAASHQEPHAPPRKKTPPTRRLVLGAVLAALAGGAGWYGVQWWQVGRFEVSTDDAYVSADTSILAAKVGGYVKEVAVAANQWVKTGDVIARIDDGDYSLSLQAAEGKIATQEAALARFDEQQKASQAAVAQAKAQLSAAEADLQRTQLEFERQDKLASSNFASRSTLDNARADRDKAQANVLSAKAAVASAEAAVGVIKAQRTEAARVLDEDRTARDQAKRDLDFTIVRAPIDGVVGNRAVQVGQLVQPGTRLAAVVPLGGVYVDANFKETQLGRLHPGQKVRIYVDAYPDRDFTGKVLSVSPASGAVFSLLPPENATGNFTKIVQRVPVRVGFDADALEGHALRPGMSVTATVDTRTDGSHAPADPAR